MPNPNSYKTKKEFMKACVPMVIEEGTAKDGKQGFAICQSMWERRGKKKTRAEVLLEGLRVDKNGER